MKACPVCACEYQKPAFTVATPGSYATVALACMRCEHVGPAVAIDSFPPARRHYNRAADLWNAGAGSRRDRGIAA